MLFKLQNHLCSARGLIPRANPTKMQYITLFFRVIRMIGVRYTLFALLRHSAQICYLCVTNYDTKKILHSRFYSKILLERRKRPVGKILFPNWKIIFSQLGNYFFPVGHYWMLFLMRFCSFWYVFFLFLFIFTLFC